jgi:hypothetical protein
MEWFNERNIEEVGIFDILAACNAGKLRLPLYQRDAVWSEGRVCALWDSLLRGFPLPSFLLVKGKGEDSSRGLAMDGIRGAVVETGGELYYDVLDGQQRLSAILAGTGRDSNIRLWIDLALPRGGNHPLRFKYWLHPCTNVFPFGFHMQAGGEHDFQVMSDNELQRLWNSIQNTEFRGKEYYELPLDCTFPWEAGCPVPLADLLGLLGQSTDTEDMKGKIQELVYRHRQAVEKFERPLVESDAEIIEGLVKGLERVKQAKLALQYINLDDVEQDENGGYELFERIGRGGVQISSRQLAVSKLMLTLGKPGNDALVGFQKTTYGRMLETEEVVHALARVALAEIKPALGIGDDASNSRSPY